MNLQRDIAAQTTAKLALDNYGETVDVGSGDERTGLPGQVVPWRTVIDSGATPNPSAAICAIAVSSLGIACFVESSAAGPPEMGTACPVNFPIAGLGESWGKLYQPTYGPPTNCNMYQNYTCSLGYNSEHPGGCQTVLCDASVQFVSEYVDYAVWQALGDRRDGREIDNAVLQE